MLKNTLKSFGLTTLLLILPILLVDIAVGQSTAPQDKICHGPYEQLTKSPIFSVPPVGAGAKVDPKSKQDPGTAQLCMSGVDQQNLAKIACVRSIQENMEKPAQFLCPLNRDCFGGGQFMFVSIGPDAAHQGKLTVCVSYTNVTKFREWARIGIW